MKEKRIQFKDIVKNQLPQYVKEDFPLVGEFLTQYYLSQEFQGAPNDLLQNIDEYIKVDSITNLTDSTILGSNITAIDADIFVDLLNSEEGTSGFPEKYGLILIDNELIVYETKSFNGFHNCYRGFSGIVSYKNTNIGIASDYKLKSSDQLIFKESDSTSHEYGSTIYNLSSLFLKEFLAKVKYQLTPGFENRSFVDKVNEATLIKQIKDFYRSKGTDRSFEILFKSLYGEDVQVLRPRDYLFRPSDAQYKITNDLVVEKISGPIEKISNLTLFQDTYLDIPKAYGPVTDFENVISYDGKIFYKLKIDGGYDRNSIVDGSIYGKFSVHAKTRTIGKFLSGSTFLDVDSTVGFPNKGELIISSENGDNILISYSSKNVTQFLGCEGITSDIENNTQVSINTYAYAVTDSGEEIKVRINSILSDVDVPSDTHYYNKGDTITIKTLGFGGNNGTLNDWIFNISPIYQVKSFELVDFADKTYSLVLENEHIFKIGDQLEIIDSSNNSKNSIIIDIPSNKTIIINGQGVLENNFYKVRKTILKVNSTKFPSANVLTANIQNIYKDKDSDDILVSSPSIPYYPNQPLESSNRTLIFSGTFSGSIFSITSLVDHGFYSGDSIYYTPEKSNITNLDADGNVSSSEVILSSLFDEGIYFIKRIDSNRVQFAKSRSDILSGKFITVNEETSVVNNKIEPYEFYGKTLQSQKIFRKISKPIVTNTPIETDPGFVGILANGVEILNYKSKDKLIYGPIESVEVLSKGSGYDIISPPKLSIIDSVGAGASGYCAVSGSLYEIKIIDPGFDYKETPRIKITGGNGYGAVAKANMKLVSHEVYFNSQKSSSVGLTSAISSITFETQHKFENGEKVIYRTNSQTAISGLSTNSVYYVSTISPTTIKLHKTLGDSLSGINTISLNDYGVGNHFFESTNKKSVLASINVINPGTGYQNKKRTVSYSGINTSLNCIEILNHDYESGDIIKYTTDGATIGGLVNNTNYYLTKIDSNSFKLSEVGTGDYSEDYFYKTKQFVDITSKNSGIHVFNYPEITVELVGNVGISSYKAQIQPIFRGEITSVHLSSGGSSYGVEDVFNIDRQPLFDIMTGSGAELIPIISNGTIKEVLINNSGNNYTSVPDLIVNGTGFGAVLVPIVSNNQITSIKIINGGYGYSSDSTEIIATSSGSGASFRAKIKNWTINLFKKYISNITGDDGIITTGLNPEYELQYSHIYAPRKLRQLLYSKDQSGNILYSNSDLRIFNNIEINSTDHSPLIGWSYDGHPIYGPYGYSTKSGGVVSQMKSGYKISLEQNRPSLNYFPEGFFVEDYKYYNSEDETVLDKNNGRFCITPEFPNGVYAYFATFETSSIESSGPFSGYKNPIFPYLIGNCYNSKPIQFNFERYSNQDYIDLNNTNWIRNTYAYNLTKEKSTYEYITIPNKLNQTIDINGVSLGSIDNIGILTGGDNYKVNDILVFDNKDYLGNIKGNSVSAIVSNLEGKYISSISVASTDLYNVEIYSSQNKGEYTIYNNSPHNFSNYDLISITGLSTTSSLIEGNYNVGIETSRLILVGKGNTTVGISSSNLTGIVTFISVQGTDFSNIRENDIFVIDSEKIKVLNVDKKSSRLRILREIDGTIGTSHTVTSILYEKPRRLTIKTNFDPKEYSYSINKEIYFDPKETLSIGMNSSIGIGTTISFSNPGVGLTQVFVPLRSLYLPNHELKTGDSLTYKTNGGSGIVVSSNGVTTSTLPNNSIVYVAKINNDLIGISTVLVGLGSTGFFTGISSTTKDIGLLYFNGIGSGKNHSFKTNYSVLTGQISKNIVTVSTAQTHGLINDDTVNINVISKTTNTIFVKYDDYNRKVLINPRSFSSSDIDVDSNSITILNHGMVSGQKVIHTSTSPAGGLINEKIYYIVFVDKNTIKLSTSYFSSKDVIPTIINITSSSSGTLSLINPPIKLYRNSNVLFDLSDSSLSYAYQSIKYPAFKLEFYVDSNFKNVFDYTGLNKEFNVQRFGIVGVTSDAKVKLNIDESIPKVLYYNLIPIFDSNIPIEKEEISFDNEVNSNNQIQIEDSLYNGTHRISVASSTSFNYFIPKIPEENYYTQEISSLKYDTNSLTAYGPIKNIKITNKGSNYYSLPGIISAISLNGSGLLMECFSNSIGSVKKTKITNVGFDFPSDYTLRPNLSLPKIIKIDRLSSFDNIKVTSFGKGYVSSPKLLVFDGKTKELIQEVDLKYELTNPEVVIKNNTYGISDVEPIIIPTNNSNGVGIKTISYNPANKKVTVGLSSGFATIESFPFKINDKVLIENISIGIGSTGKGFNSENYNYQLFTLVEVDENIGGIGSVAYSLDGYLTNSEFPGTFIPSNSSGRIIPEKFFPTFKSTLKKNEFKKGEIVRSKNSSGIVEDWDRQINYLKVESKDDFEVGNVIEGLSSKTKGVISSITNLDCYANLSAVSKSENGWQINAGFLNDELQKIQDSFYYQNFSYSLKSKIDYDTWNDAVSSLNHTVGFRKFADFQLESTLNDNSLSVGISTETTGIDVVVDMIGYGNLNCVNDFDIAKENSNKISTRIFSDKISFKNRTLTDYYESVGNRVLNIDDFSYQFNSNPRPTRYSEVNKFDVNSVRAQKYIVYVKDKRYIAQRQCSILTLLHDNYNAYINQYGRIETAYDLGTFDFIIDGSDGILQFYPQKYSINDYDIGLLSYNIRDNLIGIGSTSIGSLVEISGVSTSFSAQSTVNVVSFASTYTSSKVLIEISGDDGEYEFNELNIIHDGTNVEFLEYGNLSTKNNTLSGYGTYYPYISGSEVKVDFIANAGIGITNYINTVQVSISNTSNIGISTFDMKHSRLEARTISIPSSPTPSAQTILDYSDEYDTAYCLIQVSDITNNRHQLSEVISLNDDINSDLYVTEFANLETFSNLGTIGGITTNGGQTANLTFTPLPNIETQVKVYSNIIRLQDDDKDIIDFNSGTLETTYATYYGTERDVRKSFDLTHKSFPIFERYFNASSSSVVNLVDDTIEIPGHFFTTGEKISYSCPGAGTSQAIGIASTTISGIGLTNKLPSELYIIKINDNKVKVAISASDALKYVPNNLNLTSVGIGSSHRFTSKNQNAKVIVSIDNVIQSPVVSTSQTTSLSARVFTTDEVIYFTGITSFFGGDLIKINNEIMFIESVGLGTTNAIKVRRPWLGTEIAGYSTGSIVTKVTGNYNIVNNTINFVEPPYGNVPLSTTTNSPDSRDWIGLSTGSKFSGRSFMRSGIPNSSNEAYYKNYIFDNISSGFNGKNRFFTLKSSGSNITGISNENAVILVNDVFQGPGTNVDYTLLESSGITSIRFAGTASSVSYDINSSNLPSGGVIVSVGSTEGFGYQPLVSAGGTAIVSGFGTISSVSIANSGSGYRSGVQTIRVGVQTSDLNGFYIEYIGTASANNGNIVSIAITNPGVGYTSSNPPTVIIDSPLSYSDIPLVYSSSSSIGFGTGATVDVVVGYGSSIIDFEIKNIGYGYGESEILTVPFGGSVGIPTTPSFKEFQLSIQKVSSDKFGGWSIGELQVLDDISDLFDGETTTFPLSVAGNLISIKSAKGSNINVQDVLLVFINDILQVPGEGYIFEGGSVITFTEAPKGPTLGIPNTNDKCKIIFYKGSGSVDVIERNILETVKVGDELILGYDSSVGQSPTLLEDSRTVMSILSTDLVSTNPYFGPGNTSDESLERTITWCRQTVDKIINEKEVSKDRMLYEPIINPYAYLIKSVGIGSTVVYVDNLRPFFNQINESNSSLEFQKEITFIDQDSKVSASATAVVSTSGTITSIIISNGGFGYVNAPTVILENPIGVGTTGKSSAISYISSGIVTSISVIDPGIGYTQSNPPVVFIEPPSPKTETNIVSNYSGDFGSIVSISTTSVGIASTGILFDLVIDKDSFLRNSSITGVTTISGIQTGYYFSVFNSNIGFGITSLDEYGQIVGKGTTCLDNVYRAANVSIMQTSAPGLGVTYVARVTVSVSGYNNLSGMGQSSYYGNYSWGRIDLLSRTKENQYYAQTNSGYVGLSTGTIVKRSKSLKYSNYIP